MKGKIEVRDVLLASLAVATIIATVRGTALPVIPPSLIVEHPAPAAPLLPLPPTPRQPNELELRSAPIRAAEVIGDKCSGKDCRVVSITTSAIAVANLPTCNASSISMVRATTNGGADGGFGYMDCDGSSWRALGSAASATEELTVSSPLQLYDDGGVVNISISVINTALWSGACLACSNDVNFIGPLSNLTGTLTRVECSWETAGTGGTTNATFKVRNITDASDACSCSIGACNTAARTPMTCTCAGSLLAAKVYAMRISDDGDCTVAPQGVMCTTHVTP